MKKIYLAFLLSLICHALFAGEFVLGPLLTNNPLIIDTTLRYPLEAAQPSTAETRLALANYGVGLTFGYQSSTLHTRWGIYPHLNLIYNIGENTKNLQRWFQDINASVTVKTPWQAELIPAVTFQWRNDLGFFFGPKVSSLAFESESSSTAGNLGVSGQHHKQRLGYGAVIGLDYAVNYYSYFHVSDSYSFYPAFTLKAVVPIPGYPSDTQTLSEKFQLSGNSFQVAYVFLF